MLIISADISASLLQKLRGIEAYARLNRHIEFVRPAGIPVFRGKDPKHFEIDGVLGATLIEGKTLAGLKERGIAVVGTINQAVEPELPLVLSDMQQAGYLAARHLLEQGFSAFGFLDIVYYNVQQLRKGFTKELARNGHSCKILDVSRLSPVYQWDEYAALVKEWLIGLPKPVALLAYSDYRAAALITLARDAGFSVPNEVAVAGIGHDPFESLLLHISLSSMALNYERIGYEAMRLLDDLMHGAPPPDDPFRIPPLGLVLGDSTDTLYCASPLVRRVVGYIRDNLTDDISTAMLAERFSVSRRSLQRAFKNALGHGIHEEVLWTRVRHAQQLLLNSALPLSEIAAVCGFGDLRGLSLSFKKRVGVSPSVFRTRHFLRKRGG